MNSETQWLSQRIALLKTHFQELKEVSLREKVARQKLVQQHVSVANEHPVIKAELLIEQARQLTILITRFSQERNQLLARQKQDERDQNERINLERRKQ